MAAAEPIRDKRHIKKMTDYYLKKNEFRNYLLVIMGLHTALRISDLLSLRWRDVVDFQTRIFNRYVHITEKKTGKNKVIALNDLVINELKIYFDVAKHSAPTDFIFSNNRKKNPGPINRIQAYRIIKNAAGELNIEGNISCHSLRKTFGYHAWKKQVPIAVIMDIYNHSSFEITRRYLGICQDDRDKVYLEMSFLN